MAFKDTTERNAMNYYISDLHIGRLPGRFTTPRTGPVNTLFWPVYSVREQAGHRF